MTRKNSGLTSEILNFIVHFKASSGRPPTVREIQKALNIPSTSTVHYHLRILEKQGLIKRDKGKARGIIIPEDEIVQVPCLGFIYADKPLPGPDSPTEDFIPIPYSQLKNARKTFALRVIGESMLDAGIHPGDIVIFERVEGEEEVRNGDMVAAWIKGKDATTLKRFFRDDKGVTLKPESPLFKEPIRIEGEALENLEIQAKAIMVIRNLSHEGQP